MVSPSSIGVDERKEIGLGGDFAEYSNATANDIESTSDNV
jgi:hypothetical protein